MNKRLLILLAVLALPEVVQAVGTPGPPIIPCTLAPSYRCKPVPPPAPCGGVGQKGCEPRREPSAPRR